jgi:hypothetical protein
MTSCHHKRPDGGAGRGFHWEDAGLWHSNPVDGDLWAPDLADADDYVAALSHPAAIQGFERDLGAMSAADTFVLVLPCGRSAHLELGWAVGAKKSTAVLLDDPCTPELMYRLVDLVTAAPADLVEWLEPSTAETPRSAHTTKSFGDLRHTADPIDSEQHRGVARKGRAHQRLHPHDAPPLATEGIPDVQH